MMITTDDSTADRPSGSGVEADRRRRRRWNLLLAVCAAMGAVLSLTASVVTPVAVATAVICGLCAVLALVAVIRDR